MERKKKNIQGYHQRTYIVVVLFRCNARTRTKVYNNKGTAIVNYVYVYIYIRCRVAVVDNIRYGYKIGDKKKIKKSTPPVMTEGGRGGLRFLPRNTMESVMVCDIFF